MQMAFLREYNDFDQWLSMERRLEAKWEQLEERTYAELVGFGKRKSSFERYEPPEDSPKAKTCKPGALGVVTPWISNRIQLSQENAPEVTCEGTPDPDPTYVNASPMSLKFIAAAVPQNDDAREAFWRCIYEQDVAQIVMLNQPLDMENVPYWPHSIVVRSGSSRSYVDRINEPVVFGNMRVTCTSAHRESFGWTRSFFVELLKGDAAPAKQITQHHFTQWPDMAIPIDPKVFYDGFMLPVLTHRAHHGRPVLVHCHAGLGRTGTFITIAILLVEREKMNKGEIPKIPSVEEQIFELRKQRPDQVQALEQFKFIHRIVFDFELPQKTDSWSSLRDTLSAVRKVIQRASPKGPEEENPVQILAQSRVIKQSVDDAHSFVAPSAPSSSASSSTSSSSTSSSSSATVGVSVQSYLNRDLSTEDLSHLSSSELIELVKALAQQNASAQPKQT